MTLRALPIALSRLTCIRIVRGIARLSIPGFLLAAGLAGAAAGQSTGCPPGPANYPCVYVANSGDNTVSVISAVSNSVIATIPVGSSPQGVAITPDNSSVYVANSSSKSVSVIETATSTVKATVTTEGNPTQIAITPDGFYAWVVEPGSSGSFIEVINVGTNEVISGSTIKSLAYPTAIAIAPSGVLAYVADTCPATLTGCVDVIATPTSKVMTQVTIPNTATYQKAGIAVSPDGSLVYVTGLLTQQYYQGLTVVEGINTATNEIVLEDGIFYNEGLSNYGITVTPDDQYIYLATPNLTYMANATDSVDIWSTGGMTEWDAQVGNSPVGTAISPNGVSVYVTNSAATEGAYSVSLVNTREKAATATITVGTDPQGVVAMHVAPLPFLSLPLTPDATPAGGAEFTLTVNGAQFVPGAVVKWDGAALVTSFVSEDRLTATVPAAEIASQGTAFVTVTNPGPGGGVSNTVLFSVMSPTESIAFKTSTVAVGPFPGGIVAADFNNDGKEDLAVVNLAFQQNSACSGSVSILLGNGDGTFTSGTPLCLSGYEDAQPLIVAGDFNGDGKLDIMTWYGLIYDIHAVLFLGNGDGTFAAGSAIGLVYTDQTYSALSADFNRDGKLDLAFNGFEDEAPQFLFTQLGNGDGTFYLGPNPSNLGGAFYGCTMAAGDFNNDGILDIAGCSDTESPQLTIFLGNGDGSFTAAATQPALAPGNYSVITAGDFNGDGILDLAIADPTSNVFTILKGNGDGTFTEVTGQPAAPEFPNFVTAVDVNGDGKLDLVFTSSNNIMSIFLGNGDGTFSAGLSEAIAAPFGVAVGDFNRDGRMDLAVVNSTNNTVSILLQKAAANGDSIGLFSDVNPAYVYQPVALTAVVTGSPYAPTGSVTFKQGSTTLGTVALANGEATLTTPFTKPGGFSVTASYSGDHNNPAKNSPPVKQSVQKYTAAINAFTNLDPSTYGQAVSLGSIVYAEPGEPSPATQPTGTVTFKNGATLLGSAPLVSGQLAGISESNLPAGTLTITADYSGDDYYYAGSSTTSQVVNQASTTTKLTSSPNPSALGQRVKFTAIVTSPTVSTIHAGTVTFTAGTTTLGTVDVEGGKAALTTSSLPAGTTTVTATYNGTSNIGGSSGSVSQTVN